MNFWGLFFLSHSISNSIFTCAFANRSIINFGNYSLVLARSKLFFFLLFTKSILTISNLHCFMLNPSSLSMQFLISWRLYPHSFPGLSWYTRICHCWLEHVHCVFCPFLRLGIELPFYLEFTLRRVRYNIISHKLSQML